jgi:cytochrome c biogenesis protein CcmG, thiol:disulfide interchange protein DsbE
MKKALMILTFGSLTIISSFYNYAIGQDLGEDVYRPAGWNEHFSEKPAPAFTMVSPQGQTYTSKGLKGKIIVLDFWATWCKPCKMLTHEIDSALKKYSNTQIQIIGVNHQEKGDAVAYWKKSGYKFPMAVNDKYAKVVDAGFPSVMVIDPEGIVMGYFSAWTPTQAGEIDAIIWNFLEKPTANATTIRECNLKGEYVKALYLYDKLIAQQPALKNTLIEERMKAMLHTNPWMGINIAKQWRKDTNDNPEVLVKIGKLIADAKVQEPEINRYGIEAASKSRSGNAN